MPSWKANFRVAVVSTLLCISGCSQGKSPENFESSDSAAASALLINTWKPGTGFLLDRDERLFVTVNRLLNQEGEVEIAFSVVEDGMMLGRRSEWLTKARANRTTKGHVLIADPDRDLAVVRLVSVPEGVPEVKLAKASLENGAAVRFLGAADRADLAWAPASSSVATVGPKKVEIEKDKKVTNQMLELAADSRLGKGVAGGALVNEEGEVVGVLAGLPDIGPMLCTDLSELRPVVAAAYRTLAMNALQKGKYEKAVAYSSRGLTAWPEDPMGYNERGAAYSQQDQFEKAIADYSRAIQLEPRLPLPYRNRASAYIHLARYRDAVADCTKAIELAPGYQSAYRTRSQAYAKLKMKKEAESDDRTLAALTNPPPNKIEWKGTTVRGHPNLPNTSGQTDGYVDAHTPDGRSVRLRPPTAGDSYYRGPDGKRYIIIRPNNLPDMSGMPDFKDYPGLKNYPGSR